MPPGYHIYVYIYFFMSVFVYSNANHLFIQFRGVCCQGGYRTALSSLSGASAFLFFGPS